MNYLDKSKEELISELIKLEVENKKLNAMFEHGLSEHRLSKQKFEENNSVLRQILDSIPQSVFWKDRNSIYLGCNKVFASQTAYSPEEIIGKTDYDLPWPKVEAEAYRADDKEVMDNNNPKVHIIEPLQTADGARLFIDTTKIPLQDRNGKVYGVLGVFDDITARKQAEIKLNEFLLRQQAMISNIVDVIAIIDKDGINRYKSPNIEKWFGWEPGDLIGKLTWNNIHPDDLEKTQQIFSLLTTEPNSPKTGESRYLCKDGSYKWMEYTAVNLLHDPAVNGILLSYHDITERKNAEGLIQLEQQLKQKILDSLPGIFYLYTYPQLNLVLWNKNHETLLGYEAEEIKNRHIMDWHIPEAKEIVQKAVDLVMEKGMNVLESPLMHKDGYYVPFLMTGIRFSTPNQEYLMGIGIDITDSKKAEEALRENEKVLKESQKIAGLGSYRLNIKTGNWTSSEILDSIFGIDTNYSKTISGWAELIHPDWQEIMNNYLINEVIGNKTRFDFEYKVVQQNNKKEIWVHGLGVLEYDENGNPIFMVGTIQDISHRKNTEMLLKEQREEIEIQNEEYLQLNEELIQSNEEMSQINDELLSAKERAEESDRLKTAFLQNLSHEIRTPMNAIMGFSSLLMENYGNRAKLEKFSEIISQRCNDLLEIINDILDIAKIESGQLPVNIEKCNLNELFEELTLFFEEHQKRIGKQHINFLMKSNLDLMDNLILTDKVKLKQIFINLIGNAFKFTNEGNIEGGCKFENDNLIFYVSDTGIGIPVEKHKVIFERFTQLYHNSNKAFGGTGLGLSIVKGLVELLGGEISIDSEPGKGTTFSFTFQFRKLHPSLHDSFVKQEQSEYNFSGKTVLIVEDDFYNTEYLKEILSQFGINILYATNGKEAVQIALSQKPDLVLMDIRLPDMDGYEATRQIKQQLPGLKIIVQTAYASHDEKQRAINLGCTDYISKPTKRELLMEMIGKHFLNV